MTRYVLSHPHEGVAFPDAACVVPRSDYAAEVVRLARSVLDYAAASNKRLLDDFDRSEWLGWQAEIGRTSRRSIVSIADPGPSCRQSGPRVRHARKRP
jgi:hypothetical protein